MLNIGYETNAANWAGLYVREDNNFTFMTLEGISSIKFDLIQNILTKCFCKVFS